MSETLDRRNGGAVMVNKSPLKVATPLLKNVSSFSRTGWCIKEMLLTHVWGHASVAADEFMGDGTFFHFLLRVGGSGYNVAC